MPQFPVHADKVDFEPKNHLDLGVKLGIIDKEQAAKVSGTRFTYLIGGLAQLQYALQRFVIDELIRRGFTLIIPPLLVKERALYGTSHFPESRDQIYAIKNDNVEEGNQLFLLGSTETANFAYYMDRVIDEVQLPIKLVAYAPAFRSEAGSWGKDTKGIKRLHQFDKIEMDVVCTPDQSDAIFDELLCVNEWLMQSLQIPYQLAFKCTGDAGYYASSKQIDPEFWLPVQKEFMEMGTDTNATDFQARRLNIKFKDKQGNKAFVHTVNDTGVAMGRMLIAILEHYQQSDGSIKVPEVLKTLMGKDFIS
jgi:seryl-tRNA synthetase